jgi:PHD/YefM family antitoxin component YafN of YafNO toxin-antitoxin module
MASLHKNLSFLIDSAIRFNEPITVVTQSGNAVIISEEEYKSLTETLHLLSIADMKEKLLNGKATSVEDCVVEDAVKW